MVWSTNNGLVIKIIERAFLFQTALLAAAKEGDLAIVQALIEAKADVTATDVCLITYLLVQKLTFMK